MKEKPCFITQNTTYFVNYIFVTCKMKKRVRNDGHLSKEEYEEAEEREHNQQQQQWLKPATEVVRAVVSRVDNKDKRDELSKHLKTLNVSFYEWFKDQLVSDPAAELVAGAQDYVDHILQLEDRYLRFALN